MPLDESPIPGVWPLHGAVLRAQRYHFPPGKAHRFPPPGMILEVGIYSKPVDDKALGRLAMLNLQPVFLAWLRAFKEAAIVANTSDFTEKMVGVKTIKNLRSTFWCTRCKRGTRSQRMTWVTAPLHVPGSSHIS